MLIHGAASENRNPGTGNPYWPADAYEKCQIARIQINEYMQSLNGNGAIVIDTAVVNGEKLDGYDQINIAAGYGLEPTPGQGDGLHLSDLGQNVLGDSVVAQIESLGSLAG